MMAKSSDRIVDVRAFPFTGADPATVQKLRDVGGAFSYLQDRRHIADYDNSRQWTPTEAFEDVKIAAGAFAKWQSIRGEKIAQDYLVSLLIKPR